MLDQRRRRWADVVQMLYRCFVFAGLSGYVVGREKYAYLCYKKVYRSACNLAMKPSMDGIHGIAPEFNQLHRSKNISRNFGI